MNKKLRQLVVEHAAASVEAEVEALSGRYYRELKRIFAREWQGELPWTEALDILDRAQEIEVPRRAWMVPGQLEYIAEANLDLVKEVQSFWLDCASADWDAYRSGR